MDISRHYCKPGIPLRPNEELVSFDVVSLFTKIPVDLAVKVAEERLREDASLGLRTSLPVEDIIHIYAVFLSQNHAICI